MATLSILIRNVLARRFFLKSRNCSLFSAAAVTRFSNQTDPDCLGGWCTYNGDILFITTKVRLNYDTAKEFCSNLSSTLIHVRNADETSFLKKTAKALAGYPKFQHKLAHFWIGLTDKQKLFEFRWDDDNTTVTYSDWAPHQPSAGQEHCVALDRGYSYRWNNIRCNLKLWPICRKRGPVCLGGWCTFNGDSFYITTKVRLSYDTAKEVCSNLSSTLIHVRNADEASFLKKTAKALAGYPKFRHKLAHFWIGLTDKQKLFEFRWDDDNTTVTYSDWAPHQPSAGAEHCVVLDRGYSYRWNNIRCNLKLWPICRKSGRRNQMPAVG